MHASCTHVALFARSIETSVDFYRRHVGLVEVHRRTEDGTTVVWMGEAERRDPFVVVLLGIDPPDGGKGPVAHLGYAVASREDVDRAAAEARANGLAVEGPVEAGPIVGYYCLVADPDGNWVEFSHGQSLGTDSLAAVPLAAEALGQDPNVRGSQNE
jgi:catechol 2,3-dioxygenase-like lactoylglutathione lyase family enzyme